MRMLDRGDRCELAVLLEESDEDDFSEEQLVGVVTMPVFWLLLLERVDRD